jgi:capsule polysaccharide export protein KpsE/RkpR
LEFLTVRHFDFLEDIRQVFPSFIGGVVADRHGFVVASTKKEPSLDEEILAVSSITDRNLDDYYARMGFHKGSYITVKRDLDDHLKLCLLLHKTPQNLHKFKEFNKILRRKNI